MEPKVTIICAVRNKEAHIKDMIDSVLSQSFKDFELLIIDDASTDGTLKHMLGYHDPRIVIIADLKNRGQAACIHELIHMARGEYVGWIDGDDTLEPYCIDTCVRVLDTSPKHGLVYTDHYEMNVEGTRMGIGYRSHIPYTPNDLLYNFMTFHFRMFRKDVYNHCMPIDIKLTSACDYDLCLKMSEVTRFKRIEKTLYNYRLSENSESIIHRREMDLTVLDIIRSAIKRRKMDVTVELEYVDGLARYRYESHLPA